MARKRHTAEQITHKLQEVGIASGKRLAEVVRELESGEQAVILSAEVFWDGRASPLYSELKSASLENR